MVTSLKDISLQDRLGGRILYLVGMMGSGKSKSGPYLAKAIGYSFVDLDKIIEELLGKSISKIFSEEGEGAFREVESQVLREIGQYHSLVVATGGGVVKRSQNWGILHQGIVLWLAPDRNRLIKRLKKDLEERPLLQNVGFESSFDKIYDERIKLYSESDLKIIIDNQSPEEVAELIIKKLPGILRNSEGQVSQQTTGSLDQV